MIWYFWIIIGVVLAIATIYLAIILQYRKGESFTLPIPLLAGLVLIHFGFGVELIRYVLLVLDSAIIIFALSLRLNENKKRKSVIKMTKKGDKSILFGTRPKKDQKRG